MATGLDRPTVRPMRLDEVDVVLRACCGSVDARTAATWEQATGTPGSALIATVRGRTVGIALVVVGHSVLTIVELHVELRVQLSVDSEQANETVAALIDFVHADAPSFPVEIALPEGPRGDDLGSVVSQLGLRLVREEITVARSLPAPELEVDPLVGAMLRPYGAVGRARTIAALATAIADDEHFATRGMDAQAALDEMTVNGTIDDELDSSLWFVVEIDGVDVGVVLAHTADDEGSLAYFGLGASFRRRGLASPLHAHALHLMSVAGASTYCDGTAVGNAAMRRVFEVNGCHPTGTVRVWRRDPRPVPARLRSLDDLRNWLAADGHHLERRDGGWTRLQWRCGTARLPVDIGWSADERIVHVAHTYDMPVADGALGPLARHVASINAGLTVSGFFLDDRDGTVGFRVALHQDSAGSIPTWELIAAVRVVVGVAASHRGSIKAANHGQPSGPNLSAVRFGPPSAADPARTARRRRPA